MNVRLYTKIQRKINKDTILNRNQIKAVILETEKGWKKQKNNQNKLDQNRTLLLFVR